MDSPPSVAVFHRLGARVRGDRAVVRRLHGAGTEPHGGAARACWGHGGREGALNGPALAGGFALALLCDLRLAAPEATVGFPEAARLVLDADAALRRGVVSEVASDVAERALTLARQTAALPAFVTVSTKRRILVEREAVWAPLFAEEERALRAALLR